LNIISRRMFQNFFTAKPERARHAAAFENWLRLTRKARWRNFQDTKATFGQTDVATGLSGRTATIFDIGGNKYRIVAHVDYLRQTVKIEAVMDHKEYDQERWKRLF
jgi:mRNA interferase HigB